MKTLVIAFFASLLLFGCGSPDLDDPKYLDDILAEAIDEDRLQWRGKKGEELYYAQNEQTPYSGWSKKMYDNGQVEVLRHLKDGKTDGLRTIWYDNGQKKLQGNYKDGKTNGLMTSWADNGQKQMEGNYKDDKMDGLWTAWHMNGQKKLEGNYKDGKTDGLHIVYKEDGTIQERVIFKNGEPVKD